MSSAIPEEPMALNSPEFFYRVNSAKDIENAKARQLHAIAHHEAAHAVVALAFGAVRVTATIHPTNTKQPWIEKHWRGSCEWAWAGSAYKNRHLIGIAGVVAEAISEDDWFEDFSSCIGPDDISKTDAAFVSGNDWHKTCDDAHEILVRDWALVGRIAGALIACGSLTEAQILQLKGVAP